MSSYYKNIKVLNINGQPRLLRKADVKIRFENKLLEFKRPLYQHTNRYYLPLGEMISGLGGDISVFGNRVYIIIKDRRMILYNIEDKCKCALINDELYLSLFDIVANFNLKTRWLYNEEEIQLFWNMDISTDTIYLEKGEPALLRLEDFTAGPPYTDADNLQKFRIAVDYLYSKGIPFHVGWIPRYVDPSNNIDNDVSKMYSMANADFVFTLDYITWRNGIIGLHGYTHQHGEETTASGVEFNEKFNYEEKDIRNRLELAIEAAKWLEIPAKFFETPHYATTEFQQKIIEQYFDCIYEPCVGIWGDKVVLSPRNNRTIYIPTPLDYVDGDNGTEEMLKRIKNLKKGIIASLFYHASIEMDYITAKQKESGYPYFEYINESPLHLIVEALKEEGDKPIKITDIRI